MESSTKKYNSLGCSSCRAKFDANVKSGKLCIKYPHLFICGHTFCDNCLRKPSVYCISCKKRYKPKTNHNTRLDFLYPIHLGQLGAVICDLQFEGSNRENGEIKTDPLQKLQNESIPINLICDIHSSFINTFYCNNCKKYICNDCIVDENHCKKHDITTLKGRKATLDKEILTMKPMLEDQANKISALKEIVATDAFEGRMKYNLKMAIMEHFKLIRAMLEKEHLDILRDISNTEIGQNLQSKLLNKNVMEVNLEKLLLSVKEVLNSTENIINGTTETTPSVPVNSAVKIVRSKNRKKPTQMVEGQEVRILKPQRANQHSEARTDADLPTNNVALKTDDKMYVSLVSVKTPSDLYIRMKSWDERFDRLQLDLDSYCRTAEYDASVDWNIGDKCGALITKTWHRAILEKITDDYIYVFLYDIGEHEKVSKSELRRLSEDLKKVEDCAVKCALIGILPALGKNWPNVTCEYLKEIIARSDEFQVVKHDSNITLWMNLEIPGDALTPTVKEWKNASDMIVMQGLAIRGGPSNIESVRNELSKVSVEEPIVPNVPLKVITNWLPHPTPEKEFIGYPSHVDDDMNIYIYNPNLPISKMDEIKTGLTAKFVNTKPQASDIYWYPGQPCIAQWRRDNQFYRGQVMEIMDDNHVRVLFVDYGNFDTCPISNLRKSVAFEDVPIQVMKYKLAGIRPKGLKWETDALEYAYAEVVDKQCEIKILGTSKDGLPLIKLKIDGIVKLTDLLLKFKHGEKEECPMMLVSELPAHDRDNDLPIVSDETVV